MQQPGMDKCWSSWPAVRRCFQKWVAGTKSKSLNGREQTQAKHLKRELEVGGESAWREQRSFEVPALYCCFVCYLLSFLSCEEEWKGGDAQLGYRIINNPTVE